MKQNITVEQLNQLSTKGREQLKSWYYPKKIRGDLIIYDAPINKTLKGQVLIFGELPMQGDPTPLLSIGQMIEFLDEKDFWKEHGIVRPLMGEAYGWSLFEMKKNLLTYPSIELCDALWEAVKEVLGEN